MPDPLPPATIEAIRALAGKLSQREIAKRTGVALGTVNAVLRGTYRTPKPDPRLNEGEWVVDPPRLCRNNHLITIAPCRTCGALPKDSKDMPMVRLHCQRCASPQVIRTRGNQVRCTRCGSWLCRKDELAAKVAREKPKDA